MNFELKPRLQQFLQHWPIHPRYRRVAAPSFDIPRLRLRPVRTAENLHAPRILTDAIGKHTVRGLNIVLGREASDGEPPRRRRTPPAATSTRAVRTRFDGSGFELTHRLRKGQKRRRYHSAQDMSHIDMLHHGLSSVKCILRNFREIPPGRATTAAIDSSCTRRNAVRSQSRGIRRTNWTRRQRSLY